MKAVTEAVNKHGKVIVLEDDQITSKGFLKYMNEALELYKNEPKVMHVSGYMYPAHFASEETTFFLNIQSAPGWGTWKRAWDLYNPDAVDHLRYFSQSKELKRKFDIEGHAYFFTQLERNAGPVNYSFAVRWYASCFRAGGLSLFPAKSLVRNIGLDGTGVHCKPTKMYDVEPVDYLEIYKIPIVENDEIRKSVDTFYKEKLDRGSLRLKRLRLSFYSVARKLGLPLRKMLRWMLRRIYPEFAVFETSNIDWNLIKPTIINSLVSPKAKTTSPCHINDSSVGDYTYMSRNCWISKTKIGKFCSIGPNLVCGWGVHPVDGISTSPMFYSTLMQNGTTLSATNKVQERKPIVIGNDVHIGMNVTILDGITVGNGAVIGAGTLVSKDVPAYAIVVGNPMRVLRYRFSEEIIDQLQAVAWWDWPIEELHRVEKLLFDVEGFLSGNEQQQETPA
ncbi:MAG TPA: CatB-related O-acetyltransferase [Cyclobacteriaceae bacterium]|nr:CatB-related O-acetyltransferase [Cyclobacteriaceae bacterium]